MTKWLIAEWFDQTRAMAADQPEHPGLSARIQYEVTGGPDGDVRYFWVLEDGRLTDERRRVHRRSRRHPDPGVGRRGGHAAGGARSQRGLHAGPDEGGGVHGVMLTLLPVTNTPAYQDLRRRIAAVTEF